MLRIILAAVLLWLSMSPLMALGDTKAVTNDSLWVSKQYQPVLVFTAGPDFIRKGQAQAVSLLPPYQNYYTVNQNSQTAADVGVFVGVERDLTNLLRLQLGVAAYVDDSFKMQGDVWQFANPYFDNLSYSYSLQSKRLMFGGKLLTNFLLGDKKLYPYFSSEIGIAFNKAYGYQETPLVNGVPPTAPFASHSKTSFTYAVGLGLEYAVTEQVRLGIGYQFLDLGAASLGTTSAATTTQTLSLSHLYSNQLRFQLTVLV